MEPINDKERAEFSARLADALAEANISLTITHMVAEYNLRAGNETVTVHAARKWLRGEAIPKQDKIHILANWLGVTTSWLRFGLDKRMRVQRNGRDIAPTSSEDLSLLRDFNRLSENERGIVFELIDALNRAQNKQFPEQ